jgi:hypothetical protein
MNNAFDDVIRDSRIPYPAAFREIAVAIREEIRARRKEKDDTTDLLSTLYQCAAIENFFSSIKWTEIVNEDILVPTARACIKGIKAPYQTIGYANLSLLKKTDVKWLVEAFGEPHGHSTARNVNPGLWQHAVKEFQVAAKRDEEQFYRSHGFDVPR